MSQLAECFDAAVRVLVGEGPMKQRLVRAYVEHLEPLEDAELPQKLEEPFAGLHAAMHRVAPMGATDCRVKASVQKMSERDAAGHAARILELYGEILRMGQRAEPLKVVESGRAAASSS